MFHHVVTALRTIFGAKRQRPQDLPNAIIAAASVPEPAPPVQHHRRWWPTKVERSLRKYRAERKRKLAITVASRRRNRGL